MVAFTIFDEILLSEIDLCCEIDGMTISSFRLYLTPDDDGCLTRSSNRFECV